MYGNRSSISSAPYYAGAEKRTTGRGDKFFQDAPDCCWILSVWWNWIKMVDIIRENQPVDTVHIIVMGDV